MVLEYVSHLLLCDGEREVADKNAAAPRRLVLISHVAHIYGCTVQLERGAKLFVRVHASFIPVKRNEELLSVFAVLHFEDFLDVAVPLKLFLDLASSHLCWNVP